LGYVAFYAVGAYTTAKLTTSEGFSAWEAVIGYRGASKQIE